MDSAHPTPFPRAVDPTARQREIALAEIDAAIELVLRGAAVRVRLIGLAFADAAAGQGAALAQEAQVSFRLERDHPGGPVMVTVGPVVAG